MNQAPETQHSLILRLRHRDDAAAWQEFMEIYSPVIYRLGRRYGLQDADANELVQDVVWAVAQSVSRWEPHGPARFRAWLLRIAQNKIIDGLRRRGRQATAEGGTQMLQRLGAEPDRSGSLSGEIEYEYRAELFRRAAREVASQAKPATWQAFWMTTIEGHSMEEAAHATGLSIGAVYIARSRIVARLRAAIEQFEAHGKPTADFEPLR